MKRTRRLKLLDVLEALGKRDAEETSIRLKEASDQLNLCETAAATSASAFDSALGATRAQLVPGSLLNLGLLRVAGANIGVHAERLQAARSDLDESSAKVDTVREETELLHRRREKYAELSEAESDRVASEIGKKQEKDIDELWTSRANGGH